MDNNRTDKGNILLKLAWQRKIGSTSDWCPYSYNTPNGITIV